ncbi:UNVERIFIED_CONTAM: hypothetical protein Scaly_1007700 [Sesamum calycinum]|uniref:Rhamnogalacturonan lyase domain-containing protein n=1 Tax=Sesamum calycinum TaxID=2727403 RepID=A0AAW2QJB7_9LAMI
MITGIEYNGIDNLLEYEYKENNRGYWDLVWSKPDRQGDVFDKLEGTDVYVITEDDNQVELSFVRTWDSSSETGLPLNIDKRFVMLRGCSGFYSYAIFERLEGWPDVNITQGRIAFKLQHNLFQYMAESDDRRSCQRLMIVRKVWFSTTQRLFFLRIQTIPFSEASGFSGAIAMKCDHLLMYAVIQVDDKYQYSSDNKDSRVHGWICTDPATGFWVITPSNEFKTGGPVKQDLTSHAGPISLSMFFSTHYAGLPLIIQFRDGEPWKKVFGPVFMYLNSVQPDEDPLTLWADAKEQMLLETEKWPYDFPLSDDFPCADQRGTVTGRLLVRDRTFELGTTVSMLGSLDSSVTTNITSKSLSCQKRPYPVGNRHPDRTAAEFFVPDPNPMLMNQLYVSQPDKYRQYGLWDRYTDLYPEDLVYTIESSIYQTDWKLDNKTYVPTTWKIMFDLTNVDESSNYTLQLALASANEAELQVRINDETTEVPHFTTGSIGRDNAIARHGIHGLYWLYSVDVPGSLLVTSTNTIFLTQSRGVSPWERIMYDYIRLEGPSSNNQTQNTNEII